MRQQATASDQAPGLWLWALALCLLVLAVYGRTMAYPFVPYDDALNLSENPLLIAPTTAPLHAIWQAPFSKLYIPLTYSVWFGLTKLAGASLGASGSLEFAAPPFHILNVLLHMGNSLWVWALLRSYVRSPVALFAGAALYAVHPLQVEAVAWASGGKDIMFGALAWPALWGFVRFTGSGRWRHAVWATLVFAMALVTKPVAVIMPVAALWLTWAGPRRPAWGLASLWLLLALPLAWVTMQAQPASLAQTALTVWERLLVAGDALGFYLRKVLLPWPLAVDYGRRPELVLHTAGDWWPGLVIVAWAAAAWRRPSLRLPSLFTATCLTPVLGFVPFDFQANSTVADRYMYLPLFGCAWALALGVQAWVARERPLQRLQPLVLSLGAALVAGLAWWQCGYWRSGSALFAHALTVNPRSPLVHHCYGTALVQAGQWEAAAAQFQAALAERPVFRPVQYNLAFVREQQGRLEEAYTLYLQLQNELKSWPDAVIYAHPVDADPQMFEAPARVARLLQRYDEASALLATATRLFPKRPEVYWYGALTAQDLGRPEEALAAFQRALALGPNSALIHTSFADFLGEHGDEAQQEEYRLALRSQPDFPAALINLGGVEAKHGRFAEAEAHFRRAISAAPALTSAYVNLGVLLEQTARPGEARQAFEQALRLDAAREDAKQGLARLNAKGNG